MLKEISRISKKERREFEVFQIEVSTSSSLECHICPRTVFAEQWFLQKMSMETFRKIAQYFHRSQWVSFRGWGETLENENLVSMLHLAEQADCLTSLETNGVHLTEDIAHQLLNDGLDLLVISLEGPTPAISENMPIGSEFKRILHNVEGFVNLEKRLSYDRPLIKLSFLMTRMNMRELPSVVLLAAKLGADEVVFTHLDYLPNERWDMLKAFHHESPPAGYLENLDKVRQLGTKMGIPVKIYPFKTDEVFVCEANPPKNVFFSVNGLVGPCMYLQISKKGDIPRIFQNKGYQVPQTFFGSINDEDLGTVWDKESYRNFRKVFEDRRKAQMDMVQTFEPYGDMSSLDQEKKTRELFPPLPQLCQTCYKAYGI